MSKEIDYENIHQSIEDAIESFKVAKNNFETQREELVSINGKVSESISQLQEAKLKIEDLLEEDEDKVSKKTPRKTASKSQSSKKSSDRKRVAEESQSNLKEESEALAKPKNKVIAQNDTNDKDDSASSEDKDIESFITDDGLFDSDDIDEINF